jgi:8-oxo-dGTP pyrophosphatase MutT (NUDIX family)
MDRSPMKMLSALVLQPFYRQFRGMTLGTRTAVFDGQARVVLVRHTYSPGWMLPGGGVERGETIYQSAKRELHEEAGIVAQAEPMLHGICLNDQAFPGDHVAILSLREFTRDAFKPNSEIAAAEFFPLAALPDGVTQGTRRRLDEIFNGGLVSPHW